MSQALAYYIYARGKTYQYEQAKNEENELKILQHEKNFYIFTVHCCSLFFWTLDRLITKLCAV